MNQVKIEVCCGSADDVIQSEKAGADRVELNSDLFHGGLTPTIGSLITAKRRTKLPIMTMVRPREGGFCYTDAEFETMREDAKQLLANGSDGIVFGFLHPDGTINGERTRLLREIAGEKQAVFHRAIDVTPDWRAALDELISFGVNRVLTSGQEPDVGFAIDTIAEMIRYAAGRIEILPGAGVSRKNIGKLVERTGCTQLHVAKHIVCFDTSTANHKDIFYGGALYPPEDRYQMADCAGIAELIRGANQ